MSPFNLPSSPRKPNKSPHQADNCQSQAYTGATREEK